MEHNPVVSVIIPTYNRAHLIERALDSVLAQTYENMDIIVVDDASIDDTEAVVRRYSDSRIRYVRHDQNQGGSAARNSGIRLAKGEYIAFLDSDDEWVPEKVQRHLDVFQTHPEYHVVYSAVKNVYPDGTFRIRQHDGPEGEIFDQLMVRNVVGPTSAFVIKRECFARVGGFDESLPSAQDYDMWLRLAKHYRFKRIPEPLVIYYWHGDQITKNVEAKWHGMIAILEKYKEDLRKMHPTVTADRHFRLGKHLVDAGHPVEGRGHLLRALRMYPWRPQYTMHLALSFLGPRGYSYLRAMRRTARAGLSSKRVDDVSE